MNMDPIFLAVAGALMGAGGSVVATLLSLLRDRRAHRGRVVRYELTSDDGSSVTVDMTGKTVTSIKSSGEIPADELVERLEQIKKLGADSSGAKGSSPTTVRH